MPAHRAFTHAIEEELTRAKAALVIWSADAAKSEWVLSEANRAREARKLVQVSIDRVRLPMPFDQIQCADLAGWSGEAAHPGWRKALESVVELVGAAAASLAGRAGETRPAASLQLPDKPSIAVLPFSDPTGAVEGDYFADGMVDEIVSALTRFPSLFVIASGSSLSYRERERDFRKIGRELGVRYLLEGSVRRSGQRVRIAVDLVEAETSAQIWSERFEGALDDVFALQDEVANALAAHIEPTIQAADLRRGANRPTEDLGAYDLYLRGMQRYLGRDNASHQAAIVLLEQAVARDPTYAVAWAWLAYARVRNLRYGWTSDRPEEASKAREAVRQAMMANDDDAGSLALVAMVTAMLGGDPHSAAAMAKRALTLNPGSSLCLFAAGWVSIFDEQYEQALERLARALRLNPRAPDRHVALVGMGWVLVVLGRLEEAIPWLNEAITTRPDSPTALVHLTVALSNLGRIEEGKAVLARFEELASLKSFIEMSVAGRGWSEDYLSALKRLGVDV